MARWFGPKTLGYGVGPRGWQGWTATAVFAAAMVALRFIKPETFGLPHGTRIALLGILVIGFLFLTWLKYEPD